jgi:hypothetical protein
LRRRVKPVGIVRKSTHPIFLLSHPLDQRTQCHFSAGGMSHPLRNPFGAVAKSSFAELRRQEEERGFKERPEAAQRFFREGRPGQWPKALTQQQIEDICSVHAPIMQRFGYLLPDCGGSIALPQTRAPAPAE